MQAGIFTILFFLSFALHAANFEIKSNPNGAEIYIDEGSNKFVKLGATPFKMDTTQFYSSYVKSESFVLEVRKNGHEPYRVLVAKLPNSDVVLNVSLKVLDEIKRIKEYDLLITNLFEVQKLIRGGNFPDAINKLDALELKFDQFSVIYELKATTYYMMKDIEKALSYYRKAFAVNSDNVDAFKMKVYIEKKLGVDSEI